VYTAEYWAQLAIYPEGFIPDDCALLPNPPGEICDDRLDPMWLYPNGTWGYCPWYVDPTSELELVHDDQLQRGRGLLIPVPRIARVIRGPGGSIRPSVALES
jgi:hypothetical protein